jgi:hypothetical protein
MPYSNVREVKDVQVTDWVFEGEFHEDTQYFDTVYYVVAEDDAGERWVHEVAFPNDPQGAARLASRVLFAGKLNLKHWGFHEFFSLTLEQRLGEEAYHEDMHRRGYGHLSNGVFAGGHA